MRVAFDDPDSLTYVIPQLSGGRVYRQVDIFTTLHSYLTRINGKDP